MNGEGEDEVQEKRSAAEEGEVEGETEVDYGQSVWTTDDHQSPATWQDRVHYYLLKYN